VHSAARDKLVEEALEGEALNDRDVGDDHRAPRIDRGDRLVVVGRRRQPDYGSEAAVDWSIIRAMKQLAVVAVLLLPATALAANLDPLIAKVVDAYGGGSAWAKVKEVRATGRVVPAMRKGDGKMTRTWRSTDNFRVEIA
jgi:hypothetical protein